MSWSSWQYVVTEKSPVEGEPDAEVIWEQGTFEECVAMAKTHLGNPRFMRPDITAVRIERKYIVE